MWKSLPSRYELTAIRNGSKWMIFVSGGLGLVQMVSELDNGWCANEDAGPSRGVDCEIPHQLERRTKHSLYGCGNFFLLTCFKTVRLMMIRNEPKRTISASGELGLL